MKKSSYFLNSPQCTKETPTPQISFLPSYFTPEKYPAQCYFLYFWSPHFRCWVFCKWQNEDLARKTYLLLFVLEVRTGKSAPCSVPAWFYLQLLPGSYLPTIAVEIENPWVLAASPVSLMWSSLKLSLIFSTHIFTAASAVLYKHDTNPPILTVEESTPFGFYKEILAYNALSVLHFQ